MSFSLRYGYLALLLGLTMIYFSCREQSKKTSPQEQIIDVTLNDSITRDIPDWYFGRLSQKANFEVRDAFKLPSLQNGFDSLQIRITIDCGYERSNLIILEKNKVAWQATFHSFKFYRDDNTDLEVRDPKKEIKNPKSGWQMFTDSLIKTGILDLPDANKFGKKYQMPTDGSSVSVEIATQKKYRIYQYPSLGLNAHIEKGPDKLHEALQLIEREFDFKRPCENVEGLL